MKRKFFVEVTDTFAGEANYTWVRRYSVSASSRRGAVIKVSRHCGYQNRVIKTAEFGAESWHDISGACVRMFAHDDDDSEMAGRYLNVIKI